MMLKLQKGISFIILKLIMIRMNKVKSNFW